MNAIKLHHIKRKIINAIALSFATVFTLIAFIGLASVLYTLISQGFAGLTWNTISQNTSAPGSGGGLLNVIVGSLLISFTALIIGSPLGILAGIYLAEYSPRGRLTSIIRLLIDMLLGAPSIIIGLFIYELYVVRVGHFSGWAGCFALAVMVIPITAKTTENIYLLIPASMREAVMALGASQWELIQFNLLYVIKAGVLTGVLLALSRIIGEAAPLLFTALNNQFWSLNMSQPMPNLPITLFNYAMSPYPDWQQLAWAGALLITMYVFIINLISRYLVKQRVSPY